MADNGWNGTTVSFDSTPIGALRGCDYRNSAAKVDITSADDARHIFEDGLPDEGLTLKVVGGSALSVGDSGALVVSWNDGTSTDLGTAKLFDNSLGGELDGAIITNLDFAPTTTAP